jgi:hypothetical protein
MRSNACRLRGQVLVGAMLSLITISIDAARQGNTGPRSLRSLYEDFSSERSRVAAQEPHSPAVAALFLEAPQYSIGLLPGAVVAADFNGDGKDDLAVANFCADNRSCGNTDEPSSISILLGNGDGTFKDHVDYLRRLVRSHLLSVILTMTGRRTWRQRTFARLPPILAAPSAFCWAAATEHSDPT